MSPGNRWSLYWDHVPRSHWAVTSLKLRSDQVPNRQKEPNGEVTRHNLKSAGVSGNSGGHHLRQDDHHLPDWQKTTEGPGPQIGPRSHQVPSSHRAVVTGQWVVTALGFRVRPGSQSVSHQAGTSMQRSQLNVVVVDTSCSPADRGRAMTMDDDQQLRRAVTNTHCTENTVV